MDNFLTTLYFEYFTANQEYKNLMANHDFPDQMATVRNDQSISCKSQEVERLKKLIESYLTYKFN